MSRGRFYLVLPAVVTVVGLGASPAGSVVSSRLPSVYLVTVSNPTVKVNAADRPPNAIEIVEGDGRPVRVVERMGYGSIGVGSGQARWSPDGRMIAWLDPRGLNVENGDGSDRRLLASFSTTCSPTDIAPVYRYTQYVVIGFSPVGRRLAFARDSGLAGTASCCKGWLVVAHANGTDERRLFSFADAIHDGPEESSWSPDGHSIAFVDDGMDIRDPKFAIVDVPT